MKQTLINSISQLAVDAGNKILSVYKTNDFDIKTKADGSLVTEADHAAPVSYTHLTLPTKA